MVRSAGLLCSLVFGSFFAWLAGIFDRRIGYAGLCLNLLMCAIVAVPWRYFRQRALGWAVLVLLFSTYLAVTFALPGFAVLRSVLSSRVFVLVTVLTLLAAGAQGWRYMRAYDASWELNRRANEREVLDLRGGTFDVARGFAAPVLRDSAAGRWAARLILPIAPMIPVVATVSRAPDAFGSGVDGRALLLAALAPPVSVLFSQLPAMALVHLARLRGYERLLGRPIFNR